ncbi:hypothetical protein [Burkholderia gladioli]|uniref:hypothetical protein n=1 Tax=Burkholderia gladioli TaxID=28095 RepID=UPI00163EDEDE|nr:hypothetical protein [Burkholderia gladioli]
MANTSPITSGARAHADHTDDIGELRIEIDQRMAMATYIGTRMQLTAECLVPDSFKWPDGYQRYYWEADGLRFMLYRDRPAGAKGSRRMFFDCDNWKLRIEPGGDIYGFLGDHEIRLREREIAELKHRSSAAGVLESNKLWDAFCRAGDDRAFQRFKALLPCLAPPPGKRRGRPPRKEVSHD